MSSRPSRAASQNGRVTSSGVGRSNRTRGWCHDGRVSDEPGRLLVDQLRLMAAHHPDEVGFRVLDGTDLTFANWEATSNQLGRALQAAGVEHGDRVAIYVAADDAVRWVISYAGVDTAGAV